LLPKPYCDPRNPVEGPFGVLLIDKPHQEEVQLTLRPWSVKKVLLKSANISHCL
jgi:hypothetical protein